MKPSSSTAALAARPHPVLGMLSGCGGAGASTMAALVASAFDTPALLLDCDPLGGGIDVLLGCEQVPGPRWQQVRLRGGPLDPVSLLETLPAWGAVRFLAADGPQPLHPASVTALTMAAVEQVPVVLDLPRAAGDVRAAGLAVCDLVAVVTPAEVRGVTATAVLVAGLDAATTGIVVRGASRTLPADHIGELLGLPVWAQLLYDPAVAGDNGLQPLKVRRRTHRAVAAVLAESERRRRRPVPPLGEAAA